MTPENRQMMLFFADLVSMLVYHDLDSIRILTGVVAVSRAFTHIRDFETGAHLERMARYSRVIARAIATEAGMSDEFVEHVALFAPLHDLGKIGIPDRILRKPGNLTDQEWALMRAHPQKGLELLETVLRSFGLKDLPDIEIAKNIVLYHHEMLDGSGYPQGLMDGWIPLEARITTIADIFDALTSKRSYKEAWSIDDAFAGLDQLVESGKLDAPCVRALKAHRDEVMGIMRHYHDP